jgi:hypothetical protein
MITIASNYVAAEDDAHYRGILVTVAMGMA